MSLMSIFTVNYRSIVTILSYFSLFRINRKLVTNYVKMNSSLSLRRAFYSITQRFAVT
jgi:hypothetical protein